MQNRYTGDIGDFAKLGLLRALQTAGLTIGVNWYLVPDESHNDDGRFTNYPSLRSCDEALWDALKAILDEASLDPDQRNVSKLQTDCILKAEFYSEPLDFTDNNKSERTAIRNDWHTHALEKLKDLDLVFVDPDNGLLVPTAAGTAKENKFVTPDELAAYYHQGSTVFYYQHKARRPDSFYADQHLELLRKPEFKNASGLGLKFHKTSQRYFFFLVQPAHLESMRKGIHSFMTSPWGECFELNTFHQFV